MSAKASGSDSKPNGTANNRAHHDGSADRTFTVEQKQAVLRVRRCGPTAFYDILGLETVKTTCTDSEIKKAYRKLSLLTHPDKNGYDGADEAFKMVSRAFQILSDPDKKSKFDKFGHDPDSRFASQSAAQGASPFSGFSRSAGGGGPSFEAEMSPEELFRQFFGGGAMGNMGFGGGGPGFVFNLGGGPGVRVHQFGGDRPRRRPRAEDEQPQTASSILTSLLPLILLFIFPLLSSLFSSSTPAGPAMRFEGGMSPYTQKLTSSYHKVPYWVNPAEIRDYSKSQRKAMDDMAEKRYIHHLNVQCDVEQQQRAQLIQEAQGWFFQDEVKMGQARKMKLRSCDKLNDITRRTSVWSGF